MALVRVSKLIFIRVLTFICLLALLGLASFSTAFHAHDICLECFPLGLQIRLWQALLFVSRLSQVLTIVVGRGVVQVLAARVTR